MQMLRRAGGLKKLFEALSRFPGTNSRPARSRQEDVRRGNGQPKPFAPANIYPL